MLRVVLVTMILHASAVDSLKASVETTDKKPVKVLFIGNSLTSGLPGIFAALGGSSNSVISVSTGQSVQGAGGFDQHSVDPSEYNNIPIAIRSVEAIRQGGWDFVVLQDQSGEWFNLEPPLIQKYGRNITEQDGTKRWETYPDKLCNEVRAIGGIPIFYMDWRIRPDMNAVLFRDVDRAFTYVAGYENAMCAPFGAAMLKNMASTDLGGNTIGDCVFASCTDNIHPSTLTHYTDSCILYATITGQSPIGLADVTGLGSTYNMTMLQENAWNAYNEYKQRELAKCNLTRCIQFTGSDGNLLPLPSEPTHPTYPVVPTEPAAPPPCPPQCSRAWNECVEKYAETACMDFGALGYLCADGSGDAVSCDATGLINSTAPMLCPGDQTFTPCVCVPTCEIMVPPCAHHRPSDCKAGCGCPASQPVWDLAREKCISPYECPINHECDKYIAADYLDTGMDTAVCPNTKLGGSCKTNCLRNLCVPKPEYYDMDKYGFVCQQYTKDECGTDKDLYSSKCEWATGGKGPIFVCDAGEWVIPEGGEGTCDGGASAIDSVCEFLRDTDCIDNDVGSCSDAQITACTASVDVAFEVCAHSGLDVPCADGPSSGSDCSDCLVKSLKTSDRASKNIPDMITCCGCTGQGFAKNEFNGHQMQQMLLNACPEDG